jgi:hypothetical protein
MAIEMVPLSESCGNCLAVLCTPQKRYIDERAPLMSARWNIVLSQG